MPNVRLIPGPRAPEHVVAALTNRELSVNDFLALAPLVGIDPIVADLVGQYMCEVNVTAIGARVAIMDGPYKDRWGVIVDYTTPLFAHRLLSVRLGESDAVIQVEEYIVTPIPERWQDSTTDDLDEPRIPDED